MSDPSDMAVENSPQVSRSRSVREGTLHGRRPKHVQPKSIKRSLFLAAVRTLKSDLTDTSPEVDPLLERLRSKKSVYIYKRCCSLDLRTHPISAWSCTTTKTRQLIYTLTNSVFRHDWSTAARCIQLMVDIERCCYFIYRTLLIVLLNHPLTNSEIIDNFMTRVLNLRTRSEQLTFLRLTFHLPEDIEAYPRLQDLMSTKIQDEEMSTSDDE